MTSAVRPRGARAAPGLVSAAWLCAALLSWQGCGPASGGDGPASSALPDVALGGPDGADGAASDAGLDAIGAPDAGLAGDLGQIDAGAAGDVAPPLDAGPVGDAPGPIDGSEAADAADAPDAGAALDSGGPADAALQDGQAVEPDGAGGQDAGPTPPASLSYPLGVATVAVQKPDSDARIYTLKSSHDPGPGLPKPTAVTFDEPAGRPILRSGHLVLDALYALAVYEAGLNSVDQLTDGAFNGGKPVACKCFQTGEKWTWAWTRDTAYAVDLGLAALDPERARDTLLFKLGAPKAAVGGGKAQLVQDTGTGGSWPVSTDRVIWALGALRVLDFLSGQARQDFLKTAYNALSATIARDRQVAYRPQDGLYTGEQSFLDWREQSYPSWTAAEPVDIALSKTLSTNTAHLIALRAAAQMAAELGLKTEQASHQGMADKLAGDIDKQLSAKGATGWSAMKTTALDEAPADKRELLGTALAVLQGVGGAQKGLEALDDYPFVPHGPPVLWPQQPLVPIYHNRAIWPFVTAYGLKAAAQAGHDAVADLCVHSLVRGAALHLSHMENLEFLSGKVWVDDGPYSGPVVNSKRQLWSVAAFLSMVQDVLIGLRTSQQGLRLSPFITAKLRDGLLASSTTLTLKRLSWRGLLLDIEVVLPPIGSASAGAYLVGGVSAGGQALGTGWLGEAQLQALAGADKTVQLTVTLQAKASAGRKARLIEDDGDHRTFWGPKEPEITGLQLVQGALQLSFKLPGETGVSFEVFRDGVLVASGLQASPWTDPDSADHGSESHCYAVGARYAKSGNASHHSRPVCHWGSDFERVAEIPAWRLAAGAEQSLPAGTQTGTWATSWGKAHWSGWGAWVSKSQHERLEVAAWRPAFSGKHLLQLVYGNTAGPISTGITASTRQVVVRERPTGTVVGSAVVALPQLGPQHRWGTSGFVAADVDASKTYRIEIAQDDAVGNMSALDNAVLYTGGKGGGAQVWNRVDLAAVMTLALSKLKPAPDVKPAAVWDGKNDLDKLDKAQWLDPGAKLESWEKVGLAWDARHLYLAVVSKGFEADVAAWTLHIEGTDGAWQPAAANTGLPYLGTTPALGFDAQFAVGVRAKTDLGDGFGPWAGIWRRTAAGWHLQTRLEPAVAMWVSADKHTVSMRIAWAELGDPKKVRLAGHLRQDVAVAPYATTLPAGHVPGQAHSGGYLEIDLSGPMKASAWVVK